MASMIFFIQVLNSNFIEICSVGDNKRSVLCMCYNTVTDELITSGLDGVKVNNIRIWVAFHDTRIIILGILS